MLLASHDPIEPSIRTSRFIVQLLLTSNPFEFALVHNGTCYKMDKQLVRETSQPTFSAVLSYPFVVEVAIISAPKSCSLQRQGVENAESTIKGTQIACALSAIASMSMICSARLETDSQRNACAVSSTAYSNAFGSEVSTNCTWIPMVGRIS